MAYKRVGLIEKSLIQYITDTIQGDLVYVLGTGSSMIKFYDAFPVEPTAFLLPAMSLDVLEIAPQRQYDMGYDATYPYDIIIDIWGRSNYESKYIGSILSEKMEDELIEFRDYNQDITGACITTRMFVKNISISPIREISPGTESEHRYELSFRLEYTSNY